MYRLIKNNEMKINSKWFIIWIWIWCLSWQQKNLKIKLDNRWYQKKNLYHELNKRSSTISETKTQETNCKLIKNNRIRIEFTITIWYVCQDNKKILKNKLDNYSYEKKSLPWISEKIINDKRNTIQERNCTLIKDNRTRIDCKLDFFSRKIN